MKGFTDTIDFIKNYPIDPTKEPDRFAELSGSNNYRSGRIATFEQLKMLKNKYGIKRVINLALDSMKDQKDERFDCGGMEKPCEPLWADALGLEYYPIYMTNKPPNKDNWKKIKELLLKGDTLIHCTWGVDRTGTIAAAWRKTVEPITNKEVLEDYTYKFGGQWKMKDDHNRHLREWIKTIDFDSDYKDAVQRSIDIPIIRKKAIAVSIIVASIAYGLM